MPGSACPELSIAPIGGEGRCLDVLNREVEGLFQSDFTLLWYGDSSHCKCVGRAVDCALPKLGIDSKQIRR